MRSIFSRIAATAALFVAATAGAVNAATGQSFYNIHDPNTTTTLINILNARTAPNPEFSSLNYKPVIVAGHRGLVDQTHMENSIASIGNLIQNNVEAMELDVSISADGVPYLMHDVNLTRMLALPNYSDVNEWVSAGSPNSLKPLFWSQLTSAQLCVNGVNGYGQVFDHNTCGHNGQTITSVVNALQYAYNQNYQGLVFLDVRSHDTICQTAEYLINNLGNGNAGSAAFGAWVRGHVILKFQSQFFNGPTDYLSTVSKYTGLSQTAVAGYFWVMLAVHSNIAAAKEASTGDAAWAIDDYNNWHNVYNSYNQGSKLVSQEVSVKAVGSELNFGSDDLFDRVWESGRATAIYMPTAQCTYPAGQGTPTGTAGVYVNGGVCKALVGAMKANECGSAVQNGQWNYQGYGCTDHRAWAQFTEQSMHFGVIITDQPVFIIDWIHQNGGGAH